MKYLTLLFLLTNCATIINGTTQTVQINTTPSANIKLSNGNTCVSPCTLQLPRNQSVEITASQKYCQSASITILPKLESSFLYSGIIDYSNGAAYTLEPNPVNINLVCAN